MKIVFIAVVLFCLAVVCSAQDLPKVPREFRAAWIATVDNIDFPSRKGLTVNEQKAEMTGLLDKLQELKFNAVVFQVRPQADALYDSKLEPWSEFLTGEMGRAPGYDPLAFTIQEAHKRGILVHAWFNPYRALHPSAKTVSANHISKTRPDLVRKYGKYLWLDPGEREVQEHSLKVVLDVVRSYDVDAVHFDDYFYPYPEKDQDGKKIEFPDDQSWLKYLQHGRAMSEQSGVRRIPLSRDDWRRANVNRFIERTARETKKIKPEVMFGVSPFGIWQPDETRKIAGLNAYEELYADSRKWLQNGWVDYLAPQLYWETAREGQSFPVLLDWWNEQNTMKRHLWVGVATYRVGSNADFTAKEIANQIERTRRILPETSGAIHFSAKHLLKNTNGVSDVLQTQIYQQNALIPVSPWLSKQKPLPPKIKTQTVGDKLQISWVERGTQKAFWFVVYAKDRNGWTHSILTANRKSIALSKTRKIEQIVVTSVDHLGNESNANFRGV